MARVVFVFRSAFFQGSSLHFSRNVTVEMHYISLILSVAHIMELKWEKRLTGVPVGVKLYDHGVPEINQFCRCTSSNWIVMKEYVY